MSITKRPGSPYYHVEFVYRGERVRFSTKQTNAEVAKKQEAAKRIELGNGDAGIKPKTAAPSLKAFLADRFIPYVETKHAEKPNTVIYYKRGARYLTESTFAGLPLDEITTEHVTKFAGEYAALSPSSINCGLRSFKRALRLAWDWGITDKALRFPLAKGERVRTRVLTVDEITRYLDACRGVWRVMVTFLLFTGMRPGEVLALRWENVSLLNRGLIDIRKGKTDKAKRQLPILETLREAITAHWEAQGRPASGFVFPSPRKSGRARKLPYAEHRRALALSGVSAFVPYTSRHTALTNLGTAGVDLPTLKEIAGHSTVTMTEKYLHPQTHHIQAAFDKMPTLTTKSTTPLKRAS